MARLNKNDPRDIRGGHWYYVTGKHIELYAKEFGINAVKVFLNQRDLRRMLAEFTPPRKKRAATKSRKRSER